MKTLDELEQKEQDNLRLYQTKYSEIRITAALLLGQYRRTIKRFKNVDNVKQKLDSVTILLEKPFDIVNYIEQYEKLVHILADAATMLCHLS